MAWSASTDVEVQDDDFGMMLARQIHVIPAANAGATWNEVFEAAAVGMILAGFVPGGPGIPYAFEYCLKCLDIFDKYKKGGKWEYLPAPKFDHGVF